MSLITNAWQAGTQSQFLSNYLRAYDDDDDDVATSRRLLNIWRVKRAHICVWF